MKGEGKAVVIEDDKVNELSDDSKEKELPQPTSAVNDKPVAEAAEPAEEHEMSSKPDNASGQNDGDILGRISE